MKIVTHTNCADAVMSAVLLCACFGVDESAVKFIFSMTEKQKEQKMIKLVEEDVRKAMESSEGFCLSCENIATDCEPDTRGRRCDTCGEMNVFGTEELLIMGKIQLIEEE